MSLQNNQPTAPPASGNELFPVFLKLNQLQVLLVGAGSVGLEKLHALLGNSPATRVQIVSETIHPEVQKLISSYPNVHILQKSYEESDLSHIDLAIIATANDQVNERIRRDCRKRRILINVADKPEQCDFYLGSIVKKGDLKIAISTNGKSPTLAKRLKEIFQDNLPDQLNVTLQQLNLLRDQLRGDFAFKVRELNKVTASLIGKTKTVASEPAFAEPYTPDKSR